MTRMRIYEYAKKQNKSSKDVIAQLREMGKKVSSHMSMIEDETMQKLDSQTNQQKSSVSTKQSGNGRSKNQNHQSQQNSNKEDGKSETRSNEFQNAQSKKSSQHKPSGDRRANQGQKTNETNDPERRGRNNQNSSKKRLQNGEKTANANPEQKQHSKPTKTKMEQNQKSDYTQKRRKQGNTSANGGKSGNRQRRNDAKKNRGSANSHGKGQRNESSKSSHKPVPVPKKITYTGSLTVAELAEKLRRSSSEIIKKLMQQGVMATKNEELTSESIEVIAGDYGAEVEEEQPVDITDFSQYDTEDQEKTLQLRPPVVTMMGHVDHGKTTLLDSIRHTKVTSDESGGITQHIGAYQIEENNKKITFLDTPGHAAFTTMRSRGAQVTDLTVLVVAADDGVMPQTVEAINHAKAAEVPIIVAVNKTDVPGANSERVMQELTEHGLIPEDWGGDTIFVQLSALTGEGIDELLEMILLVSELEEYKANPDRLAAGTVIEAELDKSRGPTVSLLIQKGTLNTGDSIVVGHTFGRVRAMVNDTGRRVKTAFPSTPVEITGIQDVPEAGDPFLVFSEDKKARQIGEARAKKQLEHQRNETSKVNLDDLFAQIKQGDLKEINVIVKADVQGSVEALTSALQKIDVEGAKLNVIHTGAGAIKESDIILASASNALILGFNVRPDSNAKKTADTEKVDIRLYHVIYDAIDEMEAAMKGMLDPVYEEKVIGQVEVRTTFKVSRIGTIAGSYVMEGKVTRNSKVRVIRDGVVIFEGNIDSLKRYKEDAKEVGAGYECGITLEKYNDIKEGDTIEVYIMAEKART